MVFDYLLDDAAVYAVFNHQIADLPNPQSPYKKDNPKTWGDGVLIDFGDGTAGIAKKIEFQKTVSRCGVDLIHLTNSSITDIINWGGTFAMPSGSVWSLNALAYSTPDNPLLAMMDIGLAKDHISFDYSWVKGSPYNEHPEYVPDYVWVWAIVEYHA